MKKFGFLFIVSLITATVWGQTPMSVTGIILHEDGTPVKNIRLSVQHTRIAAKPDKTGAFTLKKVQPRDSIVVLMGKRETTKFLIGENKHISLSVSGKILSVQLDNGEVIDCLFTPVPKREASSGTVITSQMIERDGNYNITLLDALRRYVPGITIDGDNVYLRGRNSINFQGSSLFLLDGVETSLTSINSINMHDVEKIEIEKSGAGYGIKGSNGVISVTTKR